MSSSVHSVTVNHRSGERERGGTSQAFLLAWSGTTVPSVYGAETKSKGGEGWRWWGIEGRQGCTALLPGRGVWAGIWRPRGHYTSSVGHPSHGRDTAHVIRESQKWSGDQVLAPIAPGACLLGKHHRLHTTAAHGSSCRNVSLVVKVIMRNNIWVRIHNAWVMYVIYDNQLLQFN